MSVTEDKRNKAATNVFLEARNLLDYTLKITSNPKVFRPDIESRRLDVKEALENNPDAVQIICQLTNLLDSLSDPVENTYVWLINKLRNSANDIFIYAWKANNIRVGKSEEYRSLRFSNQKQSISACVELKAYISLAKRRCHLKSRRVSYWNKKVNKVHDALVAWHNKDKERYKTLDSD